MSKALIRAVRRGVQVRVIVDDIGARYSWPSVVHGLRAGGVRVARFLPTLVPGWFAYSNLRTHRKILVVDGKLAFAGGINIREGHLLGLHPAAPIQDLHFQLTGPIVRQAQDVFATDWAFCSGETLTGEAWFPELAEAGTVPAARHLGRARRGYRQAPADPVRRDHFAHSSIVIVTPYFLPEYSLITALNVAALRGVRVDIVLPEKNNLTTVQWACTAELGNCSTRLPRVVFAAPLRPYEADGGRSRMEPVWLRQLGSAQPATQFRIRRRIVRSDASGNSFRNCLRQAGLERDIPGRRRQPQPARPSARRGGTAVDPLSLISSQR